MAQKKDWRVSVTITYRTSWQNPVEKFAWIVLRTFSKVEQPSKDCCEHVFTHNSPNILQPSAWLSRDLTQDPLHAKKIHFSWQKLSLRSCNMVFHFGPCYEAAHCTGIALTLLAKSLLVIPHGWQLENLDERVYVWVGNYGYVCIHLQQCICILKHS